ncbi:MAG: 3-oxoacyl-[acyl-carrier-protein] synthase III C-terminal domain-containing protein [Smithellaceae bacterium]
MIKAQFESLGVYLPERSVSTKELIDQMANTPIFDLESLTGIKNRRWRSDSEDSYTLAMAAAAECLRKSRYGVDDLDVIICSSISRFKDGCVNLWMKPGMSKFLKKSLGLRTEAMSFDMTNACAGMLTGVHILNSMIQTGAVKTGMVVSGECITPIAETALKEIKDPIDPQFASLTVGDSGAALIMDATTDEDEGVEFIDFLTLADFSDLCMAMPSRENPGLAMYAQSVEIHQEVIRRLPKIVEFMMNKHQFSGRDFDYVIPHQTSTRAIEEALQLCSQHLDVLPETLISLEQFGNTASTSHFVVLDDHLKQKRLKKNAKVLFLALASGIVIGFVSAKIGKLEACYDH